MLLLGKISLDLFAQVVDDDDHAIDGGGQRPERPVEDEAGREMLNRSGLGVFSVYGRRARAQSCGGRIMASIRFALLLPKSNSVRVRLNNKAKATREWHKPTPCRGGCRGQGHSAGVHLLAGAAPETDSILRTCGSPSVFLLNYLLCGCCNRIFVLFSVPSEPAAVVSPGAGGLKMTMPLIL